MGADERRQAFGAQLRKCRQAADLTLADLAERTDMTFGYLSNLENGRRGVREDKVVRLEDALGLDRGYLGWFLGYAPAPSVITPEDAIEADPDIPEAVKTFMLAGLRAVRAEHDDDKD